jgi:hypothetical protein
MVSATATRRDVFAMMPTGFPTVANSDIEAEDTFNTVSNGISPIGICSVDFSGSPCEDWIDANIARCGVSI